ncbi:MAG: hypothetical protein QXQ02_02220 [Halobacteria archaeon]
MENMELLSQAWAGIQNDLNVVPTQIPVIFPLTRALYDVSFWEHGYRTNSKSLHFPVRPFMDTTRITRFANYVYDYFDLKHVIYGYIDHCAPYYYKYVEVREDKRDIALCSYIINERDNNEVIIRCTCNDFGTNDEFIQLASKYTGVHIPAHAIRMDEEDVNPCIQQLISRFLFNSVGLYLTFIPHFFGDQDTVEFIRPFQQGFTSLHALLEETEWDEINVAISSLAYFCKGEWLTEAGMIIARYYVSAKDELTLLSGIEVRDYFDIETESGLADA